MNLEKQLQSHISVALQKAFEIDLSENEITLQPTKKGFEGTYSFVIFPFVKQLSKSPVEIGNAIGTYLKAHSPIVSDFNVVQGYLNINIADTAWLAVFNELCNDTDLGQNPSKNQRVMVEYSSPNTNKPLHLGHLRNNFLGFSISEILKANGYDVCKTNIVNNRGVHICKSMYAYQQVGNGETPESSGIKGDHLVGKYYVAFDKIYKVEVEKLVAEGSSKEQAEKEAPAMKAVQEMLRQWEAGEEKVISLWQTMNEWVYAGFDETYKKMGVNFDKIYYESDTYLLGKKTVEEGLAKGIFYQKPDSSVWIDLTDEGLDQKLVLRADGTSVYITQDLGLSDTKYADFPMDKSVYVVGNEQDYHFEVLFKIMKKLGRPYANDLYHLSYGMVDLPSGRMKSREGTVVDADDLIDEMVAAAETTTIELGKIDGFNVEEAKILHQTIALGALKYFLLKVDLKKRMTFNPEESINFHGNTGPYIQYNYARICSILRKANQLQLPVIDADIIVSLHKTERDLIYILSQLSGRIELAAQEFSPSVMAQYAYEVACGYSSFFSEVSILNETDLRTKQFRVLLSKVTAQTLKVVMNLLGINVPEKM